MKEVDPSLLSQCNEKESAFTAASHFLTGAAINLQTSRCELKVTPMPHRVRNVYFRATG